jgi:hypothetical protein
LDLPTFTLKFSSCRGFHYVPGDKQPLPKVLFGNDRFREAYDEAARLWVENGRKPDLHSSVFSHQLEMNSFKTALPFLASFFSVLSQQTLLNQNMVERTQQFKENCRLIDVVKKCFPVLINFSTQSSESVRVVRLSEVKSLKALLCGEFCRAVFAEDLKPLITDFSSQFQAVFSMAASRGVDKEVLSIVKYFPMYFRAISWCSFSTKITDWRYLLLGFTVYSKSNKMSKVDDIVNDLLVSTLLSLLIPMDVPAYLLIDSGARIYSELLEKVLQHLKSNVLTDGCITFMGHSVHSSSNDEQLGKLRDYILFDESSFILSIKEKRDLGQERELSAAAVFTQIYLRSKFFEIVRILNRLNELKDSTLTSLLTHAHKTVFVDKPFFILPATEPMILSVITGVSYLLVTIFRLFWGESCSSVVSINASPDSTQCVQELMKLILSYDGFFNSINRLSASDFKEKLYIDLETSSLLSILSKFTALASAFAVVAKPQVSRSGQKVALEKGAVPQESITAFIRSTQSLLDILRRDCIAMSGPTRSDPCSRTCARCQASCYTQTSIQSTLHASVQRLSLLEASKKSSKYVEVNDGQFRCFQKMMGFMK